MLRVRTTVSGWTGGPGLATAYFAALTEDLPAAQAVVDRVRSAWVAGATAFSSTVSHLVSPQVDVVDPATGLVTNSFIVSTPLAVAGTGVANGFMPFAAAGLVRFSTGNFVEGRRVKGRHFMSPLIATAAGGAGVLSSPVQANLLAYGTALLGVPDEDPRLVVWMRPREATTGVPKPLPARAGAAFNVLTVDVPLKIAVLTSRRD